jgi:hypothetical protein
MKEEPEKINDAQERGKAFLEEYKALTEKHKIDFATYPVFRPTQSGAFEVIVQSTPIDITSQGTPSPFVKQS